MYKPVGASVVSTSSSSAPATSVLPTFQQTNRNYLTNSTMKFLNVLSLASLALAAPSKLAARQETAAGNMQQTAIGTLQDMADNLPKISPVLKGLVDKAAESEKTVKEAVDNTVSAGGDPEVLKEAYEMIRQALQAGSDAVKKSTTGVTSGVTENATDLTQKEVDLLENVITTTKDNIVSFQEIIESTGTNPQPPTMEDIQGEVEAVKDAAESFVGTIVEFADAVSMSSASDTVDVVGLKTATQELRNALENLLDVSGSTVWVPGILILKLQQETTSVSSQVGKKGNRTQLHTAM